MNTVRAQMTAEDVARWRANQSQIKALGVKPDWYTRDEAARLFMEEWRLIAEFTDTYNVDDAKFVTFSCSTGFIFESLKDFDPAEEI